MTNVNPENSTNQPAPEGKDAAGGLPLRGLAMVLIAVAVLLGLWGLYSLTQGDGNGTVATSGDEAETSATIEQGGTGDAGDADQDPNAPDAAAEDGGDDGSEGEDGEAAAGNGRDGAEADADDDERDARRDDEDGRDTRGEAAASDRSAGAAGAGTSAKSEPVVNVLNNSTVNGLAEDIYDRLEEEGIAVGEHGNLPGEVTTLKETTLYYHPGDIAGERAARDLGDRIGDTNGVPVRIEPNIDGLPEETTGPGKVTLALIGEVVL